MASAQGHGRITRRRLLRAVGGGLAVASLLTACGPVPPMAKPVDVPNPSNARSPARQAPAGAAAETTLTLMMWTHFVPEFDRWFDAFAQEWGSRHNVKIRVDHVPHLELPARHAAELATQSGHDIIQFAQTGGPILYARHLEDQDDLMQRLDRELGGWEATARNLAFVDGHLKGLPDCFLRYELLYREDLFQQEGLEPPQTWDDLLEAGRRLKPKGLPGGISYVGSHGDANSSARAILWSFGGSYIAADGRTITLDSPGTREALRFGKTLFEQALTEDVFSWDDASNNRLLAAGNTPFIHNAISAYVSIKKENPELAGKIGIALPPAGPADRRTGVWPITFGIWKFARNKTAAHGLLSAYADTWIAGFRASAGYNHPMLKGWATKPMPILGDGDDPKLHGSQDFAPFIGFMGYPGPVTPAADEVWQTYLIPQMFGRYIKTGDLEGTIRSTEAALRAIYARWQV